ncbi:MAG: hydantoinase B/oxoprolinase family protein [Kiritimatiellia bacterium]
MRSDPEISPTELSVFHQLYTSIADEMGAGLARTAYSPNIKERKDFSCALFDAQGYLLAQAAHIPVHLGAMPRSVEAARTAFPELADGDVVMLNDPFQGGTHLPDITLVSPVWRAGELLGYTATRAHHADVGGMTPGSLPNSTSIYQEGLRIPPVRVVRGGEVQEDLLRILYANSRNPAERKGDLRAQLHAHHIGETRWRERLGGRDAEELNQIHRALFDYADRQMRGALAGLPTGCWEAEDYLENAGADAIAATLRGTLRITESGVEVDLRDSDDSIEGSLNAVRAITEAAVYYVFLCWLCRNDPGCPPPVNAGSFRAITLHTRPGSVVDARLPSAVAGGNVETSQRIVDLLLTLLSRAVPGEIPAQSQGTMNNVTLGGRDFAYYETLSGGAGAGPDRPGASTIQCHMTNTLNTPVEALEFAYPLRVRRLELREGSGGEGAQRGGDGLVREWEALVPMEVTLLTERRLLAPKGAGAGGDGHPGKQLLIRPDGRPVRTLPGKGTFAMQPGDILRVETPGGGGFSPKTE